MVVKKKISKKPSTEVTANALSVNQPADFYNGIVDLVAYNKARDKFISKAPKKRGKVVRSAAKISTYEQLIFTEFNTTLPASEAPFLEYIKGHLNSQDELERSIDEFQFVGAQITGHIQAAYTGLYSTGWNDGRATLGAYEVLEIDTLSYSTEYAANWAAKNAADPDDLERVKKNMNRGTEALKAALQNNLKKLAGYGVTLVSVDELLRRPRNICCREYKERPRLRLSGHY
jgi:hypothetical protein